MGKRYLEQGYLIKLRGGTMTERKEMTMALKVVARGWTGLKWGMLGLGFLAMELNGRADDWPQWLGPRRDAVWREAGIIEKFPAGGPVVKWRTPIGGGYSGPAVSGGRVFVTDRRLAAGAKNPADPFARGSIPGSERVLCLDERTGKIIWDYEYDCPYTVSYPAGPRATPLVDEGRVFTLGSEGHLYCFDAAAGKVIWSRDLKRDYGIPTPLWGFSAHPLVDGERLICLVGGSNTTAVAFQKGTGKEMWRALSAKEPGYCPPMIYTYGGKRQLVVWHPEAINSLEPGSGALNWSVPFDVRSALSVPTPRQSDDRLLITSFYNGSKMLRVTATNATVLWEGKKASERDTDTLHSIMSTPFIEGGYIYGVCSYGQLRCLNAQTGERIWETFEATSQKEARWANAFLIKQGERFFLWNETGDLIMARLSPKGYEEIGRAHLLEPTNMAAGRPVLWSHPAFANRTMYARNDKEIISVWLGSE